MKLLRSLLRLPGEERVLDPDEAREILLEAQRLAWQGAPDALDQLGHAARHDYALFGIGRPMHEEFLETVQRLWQAAGRTELPALPTVERVPWSTWIEPTVGDVYRHARGADAEVLYLVDERSLLQKDPLHEVEALDLIARHPALAMVMLSENDLMVRRTFAEAAGGTLDLSSQTVSADLDEYAGLVGLLVRRLDLRAP